MQFVVTAMDYQDAGALDRRLTHRDAHLAGVRELIALGQFLSGGAILNDDGQMVGSTLHVDFPDKTSLQTHLQQDPYVSGKVWEHIDIRAVRLVPVSTRT
jgi:uncharacterized protein